MVLPMPSSRLAARFAMPLTLVGQNVGVTSTATLADPPATPPAAPRRRRGPLWWVGIVLVLAGLVLLGWFGWQMWGTNWTSKAHQREIATALEDDWRSGVGLDPAHVPVGEASALIRIPAFGKEYVVPVLEGTTDSILARGYGHFERTAHPGEVGNYAVAAHRVTHGEPLRRMPELRPGDQVIVETADATYTYVLDTDPNDLVVPFTANWVIQAFPKNPDAGGPQPLQGPGQRIITLTTCSELFHTDNRMIAFGHLVSQEAKQAVPPDLAHPVW